MSKEPVLDISDVRQSFRVGFWMKNVEVLHGVSFQVPRNSIFGFLGPNGAGKTTLIHLITGLRRPRSGSVRVAGFDSSQVESRARLGYLPERPYFHDHLTGESFLLYMGALSGLSRSEILPRIPEVLAMVGLSHARKLELKRFSKGMLQRVGIAQAVLHDPELLVLDEPMSGLDPLGRKEIRELITTLASQGKTIFFSTHIIPDVEAICDQVAVIQKGKLIGCGPIGQFLSQGALQTEIAFAGPAKEEAETLLSAKGKLRALPDGALKILASGQEEVDAMIRKLVDKRHKILWVAPIRPSLESIFNTGPEVLSVQESKFREFRKD
jgi:ABC-2 type transport system ATP-binding protein